MSNLSLGRKVICNGYYRKTGNSIYSENIRDVDEPFYAVNNKTTKWENETREPPHLDNSSSRFTYREEVYTPQTKPLDYDEEVIVREKKEEQFEGFICGKKRLRYAIWVNYCDGVDTGFGRTSDRNEIRSKYVDVYEVAYISKAHQWCKRYVLEDWIVNVTISQDLFVTKVK